MVTTDLWPPQIKFYPSLLSVNFLNGVKQKYPKHGQMKPKLSAWLYTTRFDLAAAALWLLVNSLFAKCQWLGPTCGEASRRRHPQFYIGVLVHGSNGRLSVFGWPLHHCIIFATAEVHGQANIVWVDTVSSIWINTDSERVALRVVEAFAFNRAAKRSGGEKAGEVVDLPHSTGANSLS